MTATEEHIDGYFNGLKDDRTPEQRKTHTCLWGGTDRFLSGWDCNDNKASYAFWACKPEHGNALESRLRQRSDMKNVRQVSPNYRPRHDVLAHIYVADNF